MTFEEYKKKMQFETKTHYTCLRLRLVTYLRDEWDIVPDETRADAKNPNYSVWIYKLSPKLERALYEYFNK